MMSILFPILILGIILVLVGIMIYQKWSGSEYYTVRIDGSDIQICESDYDGQSKLNVKVRTVRGIKSELYVVSKGGKPQTYLKGSDGKRKPIFFVVSGELMCRSFSPPAISDELTDIIKNTLEKIKQLESEKAGEIIKSDKLKPLDDKLRLALEEHEIIKSILTPAETLDNQALANLIDGGLRKAMFDPVDVFPEVIMGLVYGLIFGLAGASAIGTETLNNPIVQFLLMGVFLTVVFFFFLYERRKGVL